MVLQQYPNLISEIVLPRLGYFFKKNCEEKKTEERISPSSILHLFQLTASITGLPPERMLPTVLFGNELSNHTCCRTRFKEHFQSHQVNCRPNAVPERSETACKRVRMDRSDLKHMWLLENRVNQASAKVNQVVNSRLV